MRKTRIEILLIALTVLGMGAGLAAGLLAARMPGSAGTQPTGEGTGPGPAPVPPDRTPLVEELQLTPEQRDQMREIWESARGRVHQTFLDAQQLQKDRDDALVTLLNDEQKAQFRKLSEDYGHRFDTLLKKRDAAFEQAVEKTKSLLNESQRQKYDEILRRHVGTDAPGTRRGPATSAGALGSQAAGGVGIGNGDGKDGGK
jgi:hypothetical protein